MTSSTDPRRRRGLSSGFGGARCAWSSLSGCLASACRWPWRFCTRCFLAPRRKRPRRRRPAASRRLFFSVGGGVSGGGLGRHPASAKFYIFAQTSGLKKALGYAAMIWAILVLVRFGAGALLLIFVGGASMMSASPEPAPETGREPPRARGPILRYFDGEVALGENFLAGRWAGDRRSP